MNRIFVTLFLFCAIFLLAPRPTTAITMSWTPVGNPGNAADPATGSLYGAVPYSYNIGTYDVTNSQYVAFLNSNDPTGANLLALYNSNMSIIYTAGQYAVSGDGNLPVNFVSYYSTLRFANWMDNGQIGGDTESGAYTLLGDTPTPSNANTITRTAGATVFLPSENEWYKAAYYNPATSSYYLYPTSQQFNAQCERPDLDAQLGQLCQRRGQSDRGWRILWNDEPVRRVRHGRRSLSVERGLDRPGSGFAWRCVLQHRGQPGVLEPDRQRSVRRDRQRRLPLGKRP